MLSAIRLSFLVCNIYFKQPSQLGQLYLYIGLRTLPVSVLDMTQKPSDDEALENVEDHSLPLLPGLL